MINKIAYSTSVSCSPRKKLVSYLGFDSCKALVAERRPDAIVCKRQRLVTFIALAILIIGLIFVLF